MNKKTAQCSEVLNYTTALIHGIKKMTKYPKKVP